MPKHQHQLQKPVHRVAVENDEYLRQSIKSLKRWNMIRGISNLQPTYNLKWRWKRTHRRCSRELDYFEKTAFQTAIVSEYDQEINPTGSVQDRLPIEFVITGTNLIYLDLNNSKLQVKRKITLANGNNLAAGNVVVLLTLCFIHCFQKWTCHSVVSLLAIRIPSIYIEHTLNHCWITTKWF